MLGDSLRRRHRGDTPRAEKKVDRPRSTRPVRGRARFWGRWALAAVVMLIGSFGVGYLLSTQVLFPKPDTAGTGIPTPDLYGETRQDAERAIREAGLQVGEVSQLASIDTDRGRVLARDPVPGQQLHPGGLVSMAVSGGRPALVVPPVTGMTVRSATELLEELGFAVTVQQNEGGGAGDGVVVSSRPTSGSTHTLPTMVTLVVGARATPDSVEIDDPIPGVPVPGGAR